MRVMDFIPWPPLPQERRKSGSPLPLGEGLGVRSDAYQLPNRKWYAGGRRLGQSGCYGATLITPTAPTEASMNEWVTNGYEPASGMVSSATAPPPGGIVSV